MRNNVIFVIVIVVILIRGKKYIQKADQLNCVVEKQKIIRAVTSKQWYWRAMVLINNNTSKQQC